MKRTPDLAPEVLHRYAWQTPDKPAEAWREIWGDARRVTLEIGSGNGHFLVDLAERHPNEFYVGIEIRRKRVFKAIRKSHLRELANIHWLWMPFQPAFESMLKQGLRQCFDQIYVTFPEPWPQRKHRGRRFFQPEFLDQCWQLLKSDGTLMLITDHAAYLGESCERVDSHGRFFRHPEGYALSWPGLSRSLFEDMWREQGRAIYYCPFWKQSQSYAEI